MKTTTCLLFTVTTTTIAAMTLAARAAHAAEPSADGAGGAVQTAREGDDRRVLSAFAPGGGRISVGGGVSTFLVIPFAEVRFDLGLSDHVSFHGRGSTLGIAFAGESGLRVQLARGAGSAVALDLVGGAVTIDGDDGGDNDLVTFAKASALVSLEAGSTTLTARFGLPMLLSKSDVDRPSKRFLLVESGFGVEVPVSSGANFFAELSAWILFERFDGIPAIPSLTLGLSI
ncbi:hypothetical protein L6R52_01280 [Myxococcota bacterium]|nr:hypothetical protein [Myxococcota bacterium]